MADARQDPAQSSSHAVHFSPAFIQLAQRKSQPASAPKGDLLFQLKCTSCKNSSRPASIDPAASGTLFTAPSPSAATSSQPAIWAAFPTTKTGVGKNKGKAVETRFTAVESLAKEVEVALVWDDDRQSWTLEPLTAHLALKPDRSSRPPPTPAIPTPAELHSNNASFFSSAAPDPFAAFRSGTLPSAAAAKESSPPPRSRPTSSGGLANLLNPATSPAASTADADADDDDDDFDEVALPAVPSVPGYLRTPAGAAPEVEDFGDLGGGSLGARAQTAKLVPEKKQQPQLALPSRKRASPPPPAQPAAKRSPPPVAALNRPVVPSPALPSTATPASVPAPAVPSPAPAAAAPGPALYGRKGLAPSTTSGPSPPRPAPAPHPSYGRKGPVAYSAPAVTADEPASEEEEDEEDSSDEMEMEAVPVPVAALPPPGAGKGGGLKARPPPQPPLAAAVLAQKKPASAPVPLPPPAGPAAVSPPRTRAAPAPAPVAAGMTGRKAPAAAAPAPAPGAKASKGIRRVVPDVSDSSSSGGSGSSSEDDDSDDDEDATGAPPALLSGVSRAAVNARMAEVRSSSSHPAAAPSGSASPAPGQTEYPSIKAAAAVQQQAQAQARMALLRAEAARQAQAQAERGRLAARAARAAEGKVGGKGLPRTYDPLQAEREADIPDSSEEE
ncbi:hypothetical protein JCM10450v2_005707 [Rhodotorula kratochvilovae]